MNPFDTSGFPPRWNCGIGWTEQPWIGWLHIVSDAVIFLAYFAVPVVVMHFVRQRDDLKFPPIFYVFLAMVFFSCGLVHLIEAGIFWWPAYKLSGLTKLVTACVSATGVVLLTKVMPIALDVKSGAAYAAAVEEKQHAEEELKLNMNRLTLATKAGGIGVWDYDIVNNILVWDDDMYKIYGVSPDRFSGAYEAWEEVLHPDDKDAEAERLQRAIRGEEEFDTEFRVIWPDDGSVHYIKANGTVIRGEDGEAERMIGVNWDNTERRRNEDRLRLATGRAEAAAEAKSEFLANMSHEIRTPMNGIMGMTELLLGTELKKDQRDYLGLIGQSAESLLSVINDILDFSKIEAGKLQIDPHEFDLRDSIGDTLQTLGYRAEEKGLELAYQVQSNVPDCVVGDLGRIRQVLVNLVGNALKFTEEGEVVVDVQLESRTRDNVSLHFLVKDTGIGISDEKQQAIFESFSQAESSTTRTHGGTGLGLAISQSLVDLMKGRIWVESDPGEGSTFHFTVLLGAGLEEDGPLRGLPETLHDLPVLVVDDNATNRKILEQTLKNWEMAPATASGGAEALDQLAAAAAADDESARPFQLVLLDVMMPEMDGIEVARRIGEEHGESAPGILVLSSAGQPVTPDQAKELGIDRILAKPVKQSDLLDAITRLFGASTRDEVGRERGLAARPEDVRPMRVLLVEDGRVNQMVAIKLLEERGHSVVVAFDGQVAVDLHEKDEHPFDAILMDVQMPRLDGYAATAMIREREKTSGERVPIIAMTANAMKGDREKCLDAGMDDYVAKPVRSEELFAALEQYGRGSAAEDDGGVVDNSAEAEEAPAGDAAVFEEREFRDSLGDTELMCQLIDVFDEEFGQCLEGARRAVSAGDADSLHASTYSLMSLIGNYSAPAALRAAMDLDDLARRGELGGAGDSLAACEREVDRLRTALEAFRDTLPPE